MSHLYNRIKELCDKKHITISKMCKEAQIPNSVIYELKSGKRSGISTKTALKLAEYFEVPVDFLYATIYVNTDDVSTVVDREFEQKKEPPIMDGKTFEVVNLLNKLTEENFERAFDYIRYLLSTQK